MPKFVWMRLFFFGLVLGNFSYSSTVIIKASIVTGCSLEPDIFSSGTGSNKDSLVVLAMVAAAAAAVAVVSMWSVGPES